MRKTFDAQEAMMVSNVTTKRKSKLREWEHKCDVCGLEWCSDSWLGCPGCHAQEARRRLKHHYDINLGRGVAPEQKLRELLPDVEKIVCVAEQDFEEHGVLIIGSEWLMPVVAKLREALTAAGIDSRPQDQAASAETTNPGSRPTPNDGEA